MAKIHPNWDKSPPGCEITKKKIYKKIVDVNYMERQINKHSNI